MFRRFYPKEYMNSTYSIDFSKYYRKGFRGILFDVDNTLVPHNFPADERSRELFKQLREIGFETCLISNNKEPRVAEFSKRIGNKYYIYKANKPSRSAYHKAMKLMGTNQKNTIFVGDQLFTDIYGANRVGLYSILVKPMNPKEEIQIVLKRYFEDIVLYFYQKQR